MAFEWKPEESQYYLATDGSQTLNGGDFNKNVGSQFTIDAENCVLTLNKESGDIIWPDNPGHNGVGVTTFTLNAGEFKVNTDNLYIGDDINGDDAAYALNLRLSGESKMNVNAKLGINIIHVPAGFNGTDPTSTELRDNSQLSLITGENYQMLFGSGDINVLDNSMLNLIANTFIFEYVNDEHPFPRTHPKITLGGKGNSSECNATVTLANKTVDKSANLLTDLKGYIFNFDQLTRQ